MSLFLGATAFCLLCSFASVVGLRFAKGARRVSVGRVPEIDLGKCAACGLCAKACKATPSAVRCVNDLSLCGYCVYCYGYFGEDPASNPEVRLCPTGALSRKRLSEFRYEYSIDRAKCVACGSCVRSCREHGNKSLGLVVDKSLCLGCDDCAALKACPHGAISRA